MAAGAGEPLGLGGLRAAPLQRVPGRAVLVQVLEGARTAGRVEPGVLGGC